MLKKTLVAGLLLSVVAVTSLANSADARHGRKCPRGQEDIGGKCVPDPTPGNNIPVAPTIL